MKYYIIRSEYNRIIDAETDLEAFIRSKRICKNPSDHVFVVKESGIVKISKEDIKEFIKEIAGNMAEEERTE